MSPSNGRYCMKRCQRVSSSPGPARESGSDRMRLSAYYTHQLAIGSCRWVALVAGAVLREGGSGDAQLTVVVCCVQGQHHQLHRHLGQRDALCHQHGVERPGGGGGRACLCSSSVLAAWLCCMMLGHQHGVERPGGGGGRVTYTAVELRSGSGMSQQGGWAIGDKLRLPVAKPGSVACRARRERGPRV